MKLKYLLLLPIVLLLFLSIVLLTKEDSDILIITSPKIYSFYQTSDTESYQISLLINIPDTYHSNTDYIENSYIKDDRSIVPITIRKIHKDSNELVINDIGYYRIDLEFDLDVETIQDIQIPEAYLSLQYQNDTIIEVFIGEFNYAFKKETDDIYLYNLIATYEKIYNVETVSGINIELFNSESENIVIKRFDILSTNIEFNNDYTTKIQSNITMESKTEDIIIDPNFTHDSNEYNYQDILFKKDTSINLYIPISYYQDYDFIHRFVIVMTYEINGETRRYYLDDFMFMQTNIFSEEYQEGFMYYTYDY